MALATAYTAPALVGFALIFVSLSSLDAHLAQEAVERQEAFFAQPRGLD